MLTLAQIQTLSNEVMFDELILQTAAPIIEATDVEDRITIAQHITQMTIVVTLDKLAALISDIPSADDLASQVMAQMVEDFLGSLDN